MCKGFLEYRWESSLWIYIYERLCWSCDRTHTEPVQGVIFYWMGTSPKKMTKDIELKGGIWSRVLELHGPHHQGTWPWCDRKHNIGQTWNLHEESWFVDQVDWSKWSRLIRLTPLFHSNIRVLSWTDGIEKLWLAERKVQSRPVVAAAVEEEKVTFWFAAMRQTPAVSDHMTPKWTRFSLTESLPCILHSELEVKGQQSAHLLPASFFFPFYN